ncbi:MAG: hypothetical protein EAZ08_00995 [Cytophagales bacterium]|nr:MAG: hypothetical protein EAZ08_00995 [Cytophagales bacterium]
MHQKIAKIISAVLHPALIPTYLFAFLLFDTSIVPYHEHKWMLLGIVFLFTFVFPVLSFFSFLKAKIISAIDIPNREERIKPFLLMSLLYVFITYLFFRLSPIFDVLTLMMLGISFVLVLVTLITFVHKISVHAAGVSGGLGTLLGLQYKYAHEDFLYPVLFFVLLTGIVMSARLSLKAHTLSELMNGFSLGLLITFGVLAFL